VTEADSTIFISRAGGMNRGSEYYHISGRTVDSPYPEFVGLEDLDNTLQKIRDNQLMGN
jgi:hypothetical protein